MHHIPSDFVRSRITPQKDNVHPKKDDEQYAKGNNFWDNKGKNKIGREDKQWHKKHGHNGPKSKLTKHAFHKTL